MLLKIEELLESYSKKFNLSSQFKLIKIDSFWEEIAGEKIFQNTQISFIKDGILYVKVKNSAWVYELSCLKEIIRQKINQKLNENIIKDLHFKTGIIKKNYSKSILKSAPPLSNQEEEKIKTILENISDDHLREILGRILTKSIQLKHLKKKSGWNKCVSCGDLSKEHLCPFCQLKK
ncbi:MAG: DUF721 domain-containing protein [Armatimonadetes bacterium]|nr:DUF721 domain-containing protein [Armatimonadota bacterium]